MQLIRPVTLPLTGRSFTYFPEPRLWPIARWLGAARSILALYEWPTIYEPLTYRGLALITSLAAGKCDAEAFAGAGWVVFRRAT